MARPAFRNRLFAAILRLYPINREVLLHVKRESVRVEKGLAGVASSRPVYAVAVLTGGYTLHVAISAYSQ